MGRGRRVTHGDVAHRPSRLTSSARARRSAPMCTERDVVGSLPNSHNVIEAY